VDGLFVPNERVAVFTFTLSYFFALLDGKKFPVFAFLPVPSAGPK
jgi:hypothetical protein